MARLEMSGQIIAANASFGEILGVAPDELAGRQLLEFVHPDDEDAVRQGRMTSFRHGKIEADLRCLRGDGSTCWTRMAISLARDEDGSPLYLVATLFDIGDLKSAEASLRREALYDPETDMPTHRLLVDHLELALREAERSGEGVVVGVIRLDAEAPIVVSGERLAGAVRMNDTVARLGHREFAVVLPGSSPEVVESMLPRSTVSAIGVAVSPADGTRGPELLAVAQARADSAPAGAGAVDESDVAVRLQALQPVSVFLAASEQVLARIARYTSRHTTPAGAELLLDWSRPSLHVVEEGLLEVIPDGQEAPVMTLAASDFIGTEEHDERVTVRLRAVTETRLLVLEDQALELVAPDGSPLRANIREAVQRRSLQLRRMSERMVPRGGFQAQKIAVYSTKGGAGRTTFATNLASELAKSYPGEVLLVDLALPFNHVALVCNLAPFTCLARLSGLDPSILAGTLRGALADHTDGFMVLSTALRPEEAELVTADLVASAVEHLAPQFRYVIFDLGTALNDTAIAVLDRCDRLVTLATPELTTMHDTRVFLEIATSALHLPTGAIDVVLNHRSPQSAMGRRSVEEVLARPVAVEIGYLGSRVEKSVLAGALAVRQPQGSPLSEGVRTFAQRLARGRLSGIA